MPLFSNKLLPLVRALVCIAATAGLALPMGQADTVEGLYEATRPIEDQSRELREEAIRDAFAEVLARISGRTALAEEVTLPAIATAIEQANRYVQQFRYSRNPDAETEEDPAQRLWVRFDAQAVKSVLRDNGLPVWGRTRPATLVWLAIDEGRERKLIGNDAEHRAREILQEQAKRRGLPIRLPFLDLADRSTIQVTDVWGNFEERISRASKRYETEAVLVGRVHQTRTGLWQARWTLYEQRQRNDWTASGPELNQVLVPGIDQTTRAMAIRYADIGTSNANQLLLRVNAITGLSDYNRVLEYLRTLSPVSGVRPQSLNGQQVTFALTTRTGRTGVMQAISLGHVLVKATDTDTGRPAESRPALSGAPRNEPDLAYRLVP